MSQQKIVDAYHASMGENFKGLPKMPKAIAEVRVEQLQEELVSVDPSETDRIAVLNSEIAETEEIMATQNYSETPEDVEYWNTYRAGLREFISNL